MSPTRAQRGVHWTIRSGAAALALGMGLIAAHARQPLPSPAIDTLFSWRAPVTVEEGAGSSPGRLARLFLPASVLTRTRSGLSDLRLLDAAGREVPFAVDREAGLRRRVGELATAPAAIRSASQTRSQIEEDVTLWTESYELSAPPNRWSSGARSAEGARLFLRVVTGRSRFVKRLRAATVGGSPRELLDDESLFRLPDPLRERVRFELPAGTQTLRVELGGEDGGWLEPTFVWEREIELSDRPEPRTVDLPLDLVSRSQEADETVLVLERPRGVTPLAIVFETTTPLFRRPVSVLDTGSEVALRLLLEGEIRRIGAGEEELVLPWPATSRPSGGRLEIRVLDRDSPALEDLRVALRLARPALLFAADARPDRLVWGGARVREPRYDVASLVPALPAIGERAALARPLLEEEALIDASLGDAEPNPRFDPVSPLDFAMAPGREIDPRTFSHARTLSAPPAEQGLYRLTLSAADQAVLRADFGDLRVVDPQARQRPYLLVRDSGRERVRAGVRSSHPDGVTLLRLELPSVPLSVAAVLLEVDDPFFERAYTVEGLRDGASEPGILARGLLRRERGAIDGSRIVEIPLAAPRIESLTVRIVDGSDRPLAVGGAELEIPAPEVLFPAPAGVYLALLGEPDLEPPRYELESVRSLVQAIDSTEVARGPLQPNDEFSLAARMRRGSGLERTILGAALGVAVIALTVVTLRLAGPGRRGGHVPNSASVTGGREGGDEDDDETPGSAGETSPGP